MKPDRNNSWDKNNYLGAVSINYQNYHRARLERPCWTPTAFSKTLKRPGVGLNIPGKGVAGHILTNLKRSLEIN